MATEQEKTRYSDEELQEFKTLILEKIEVAKKSYEQLMAKLQADESRNSFNMLEEGANTQARRGKPACSSPARLHQETAGSARAH